MNGEGFLIHRFHGNVVSKSRGDENEWMGAKARWWGGAMMEGADKFCFLLSPTPHFPFCVRPTAANQLDRTQTGASCGDYWWGKDAAVRLVNGKLIWVAWVGGRGMNKTNSHISAMLSVQNHRQSVSEQFGARKWSQLRHFLLRTPSSWWKHFVRISVELRFSSYFSANEDLEMTSVFTQEDFGLWIIKKLWVLFSPVLFYCSPSMKWWCIKSPKCPKPSLRPT